MKLKEGEGFVHCDRQQGKEQSFASPAHVAVPRQANYRYVSANDAKVSRFGNALVLRSHLQSQTTTIIQLLRSSLKEDAAKGVDAFN